MATFRVTNPSRTGRIRESEHRGSAIVIGSRDEVRESGAEHAVRVRDAALAPEHLVVGFDEGRFWVRDLETAGGTYLEGEAVSGRAPVGDGATIVAGNTRFRAAVHPEKEEIVLEHGFFHIDYRHDPLRWAKLETGIGRYAPVRAGNGLVLLALVAAVPFFFVADASRDALLSPGPVNHDEVFAALGETARLSDRIGAAHRLLEEDGCEACHEPFERAGTRNCARSGCHADLAARQHPFGGWGDAAPAWVPRGAASCGSCHSEHRGSLVPDVAETPGSCDLCHDAAVLEARIPDAEEIARPPASSPTETVALAYNTFSHRAHGDIACERCHARADEGAPRAPRSEFRTVLFEDCMECHGAERVADAPPATPIREVSWHGAKDDQGARCLACHEERYAAPLRTVAAPPSREPRLFRLRTRPHAHLRDVAPAFSAKECADCHLRGAELLGGREVRDAVFSHREHLASLEAPSSSECAGCHREVARSGSLAAVAPDEVWDARRCGETCHVAEEGGPSLVSAVPRTPRRPAPGAPASEAPRRIDFPHGAHEEVDCARCHVFEGGADAGGLAAPSTLEEARDCSGCHDRTHAEIGGGSCETCHRIGVPGIPDDPVYRGETIAWERPAQWSFSHFSPGHAELTREDCAACHDAPGTRRAETVAEVPVPTEALPVCRGCHVRERARFHWR